VVERASSSVAVAKSPVALLRGALDGLTGAAVFGWRNLAVSAGLFLGALLALFKFQRYLHIDRFALSHYPHWTYQAYALLHGQWQLDPYIPVTAKSPIPVDTAIINGHIYMYYPPFPAILMMPMVAIYGLRASDVMFTAVVSAAILPLMYLLFEQVRVNGLTRRDWRINLTMSVLLYFGSIIIFLSLGGRLWFTTHVVCVAVTLLALLMAFRRQYVLSAIFMGCAFFTRFPLALGFPLLFYLAWDDAGRQALLVPFLASLLARRPNWRMVPLRRLVPLGAATLMVVALFLVRNTLAFGSPLETGYNAMIKQDYSQLTQLYSLQFVPANFVTFFLALPHVVYPAGRFDRHPGFSMLNGGIGISVLVTTPLFWFLLWRNKQHSVLRIACWITIVLIVGALLPFVTAGWDQFGVRYLTDAYPFAFLLLALTDARVDWRFIAVGSLGIAINFLGAAQWWAAYTYHL
jgi:hypothetical protein